MPHCTLTGFFHDEETAVPIYIHALAEAWGQQSETRPSPVVTITGLMLTEQFHGLTLAAPWLQRVTAVFAQTAHSPSRTNAIRPKDWLHLSLAYGFPPAQHAGLAALAQECIAINTAVAWELRFYQRHPDHTWTCHQQWPL
jgi:ubiquitin-associated SH3 domain-containing protein